MDNPPQNRATVAPPPSRKTASEQSSAVRRLPPVGEPEPHLGLGLHLWQGLQEVEVSEPTLFADLLADHSNYYSRKSLGKLAVGVGVSAVVANTSMDEHFRDFYQENVRNVQTDEYTEALHTPKILGNGYLTLPVFAGAALMGSWFDEAPAGRGVGEWGQRSLRTVLVGAPPLLAMQMATGASRPGESGAGSAWKPFQDVNGVSGHSFMGAVPFLSAAKMTDDPLWKSAFYFGSTLAGISRINDDGHYASQVMLGWWMAYIAADAVNQTQRTTKNLSVFPMAFGDGMGVGVEYRR